MASTTGGETQTNTVTADNVLTYDFGYFGGGDGSIGDYVWFDQNGNGLQDEPVAAGLANVTVELLDNTSTVIATETTDANGAYLFTGLAAGQYEVDLVEGTLPGGGGAFALTTGNEPLVVNLGLDEDFLTADFGYTFAPPPSDPGANFGDRVWNDLDGDGQDLLIAEPSLNGVTVNATGEIDGDGFPDYFNSAVTAGSGSYFFGNLPPGTYTATVDFSTVPPTQTERTFDFDGVLTPDTATLSLTAGANNFDIDFGYREISNGSIGDRVWEDTNGDGVQDVGETGINGVTVELVDAGGTVIDTQVTSGDGNYTFSGLVAGTYTVRVVESTLPTGLAQTYDLDGLVTRSEATVTLATGETRDDVDFGYGPCGECDGKITRLTLQYLGDSTATVEVLAKRGPTTDTVFSGTLNPGDDFTMVGPQTGNGGFIGTLGTEIRIFVDGVHHTTIHTSCSVPVGPGTVSGDFLVVSGYSRHGGLLCPTGDPTDPPMGDECGCEGKVTRLQLQYLGTSTSTIDVEARGGPSTEMLFAGSVAPGEVFEVLGAFASSPGFAGTLGTEIRIFVDGVLHTTIHTSCSVPVGPGQIAGDFLVISGESKSLPGPLCPVDGTEYPYCPTGAADSDVGNSNGHALTLPGISNNLIFEFGTGSFVEFDNGTARLTGTLIDVNDSNRGFAVDVSFSGLTTVTPAGSPKKDLADSAYLENGGPVDTDSWRYYTTFSGSLSGTGTWADALVTITRAGSAYQVGNGANDKNVDFGASGWFTWSVGQQPAVGSLPSVGQGDINIDLDPGECSIPLGLIGNEVWNDENGNGVKDGSESGIGYVTVRLLDNGGNILEVTTTNGSGVYGFDDLMAGTYVVKVDESTLPADLSEATIDLDGTATQGMATLTLGAGEDRTDVDFGYRAPDICPYCVDYAGWLQARYSDWHPDNTYYWAEAGNHRGWLEADQGTDFDLYLYKWNGSAWRVVASSYSDGTSNEYIDYDGGSGYYVWRIHAYAGSGGYIVRLDTP